MATRCSRSKEIEYAAGHIALGNGDATFMADHWNPLHVDFYEKAGGDAKLYREGVYSEVRCRAT